MSTHPAQAHDQHVGHIVPMRILIGVWLVLLMLTALTVAVVLVDLGKLNLWVAIGIATLKASLVLLYFMHLRYDSPFNAIIIITALMFVMLFVGFALMDSRAYQPDIQTWQEKQASMSP
jgi:cytochrome c oxidase subunit 4